MTPEALTRHTPKKHEAAIVFVHGFSGKADETWGQFPDFLAAGGRLTGWDMWSLGYPSSLRIDLAGIWSADPALQTIADFIRMQFTVPPLNEYKAVALIAHSMGGLVVQRALLDDDGLTSKVRHIVLFGTPSGGLVKAVILQLLKRQFRDMARGGDFITALRQQWTAKFGVDQKFKFLAVGGLTDEFVPYRSSLEPFLMEQRKVVPGNHLQIVKPQNADSASVKLVIEQLTGGPQVGSRWNSALVAVESGKFQQAIDELGPHRHELDNETAVQLAIALEKCDRQTEAIELLTERQDTDAMGTLGGRFKRRWLRERRQKDADIALDLYRKAFGLSQATKPAQAFYHAINIAFLQLAYKGDHTEAQVWARKALEFAEVAASKEKAADCWRLATEGEAKLLLGEEAEGLERYKLAREATSDPWKWDSMFMQATHIARTLEDEALAGRLAEIFDKPLI